MLKIRTNLVGGALTTVFAVAVLVLIPFEIETEKQIGASRVGSDLLPRIIAMLMVFLGGLLIVQSLAMKKEKTVEIPTRAIKAVAMVFAILALCIVIFHFAGFIAAGLALSVLFLLYLGSRDWKAYAICGGLTLLIYFSFRFLLHVPMT